MGCPLVNAYMNIQVRILTAQAKANVKELEAELARLRGGMNRAGQASGGFGATLRPNQLAKWGSQLQWTGRQLQYNFTLPLLLAGGAATKFALDNERSLTKVIKVYGDGSAAFNHLSQTEIPALSRAFAALSDRFGVHQAEVIDIASAWAAAGASGIALAKSTKLTLEAMILGEMNATEATQALIAIQAQYGFTVEQLSSTLNILNMVENQTGITMQGLIQGFARAAGAARGAGVDTQHLAAMLAALTPAAGSAAAAGNALKTMISRLLAPTKEATQVLGLMGINTREASWQSLNAVQRLEMLAKSFNKLDDAQKAVVSSVIAGRFQINRFDVLMRDIINTNGYYQKSLKSTADAQANFKQRQRELNTVLESNPQKLKQIWVILQNALANVIQPMLPMILNLASVVANLALSFSHLSPSIQKLIMTAALMLAVIGPLIRYIGATATLFGELGNVARWVLGPIGGLAKGLFSFVAIPFSAIGSGIGAVAGSLFSFGTKVIPSIGGKLFGLGRFLVEFGGIFARFGLKAALTLAGLPAALLNPIKLIKMIVATGFKSVIRVALTSLAGLGRILLGPWGIAIAAILTLLYVFRNRIRNLFRDIVNVFRNQSAGIGKIFAPLVNFFDRIVNKITAVFWKLPGGVRDAFFAVVRVVQQAAMAVYKLFSYLNPFAHHSPSLVESVQAGMAIVKNEFAGVANVGSVLDRVAKDVANFRAILDSLGGGQFSADRIDIAKSFPSALPLFDKLIGNLKVLNNLLAQQKVLVDAQQAVVDNWKAALDRANTALDKQETKLAKLQDKATALSDAIDAHKKALEDFASAPIQGMKQMSDAIFQNEMAQKALRLEMLKFEQVNGTIDDLRNRLAGLQGDIETMRAEASDLRQAGAGSDILGPIQSQIAAMEAQRTALENSIQNSPLNALQAQLDELAKQGEILNLENSLQFDPLTKQVDDLVNSMKELPFDAIIAGIQNEKAAIAALQPQLDAANAAVEKQKIVVDAARAARDAIQASYDAEDKKLQALKDTYGAIEDAIRGVEQAIRDMNSAASSKNKDSLSNAGENFLAAKGGNFPDPGGFAQIGREGDLKDQSKLIDDFTKNIASETAKIFGSFNMFAPIKQKWNEVWSWMKTTVGPVIGPIVSGVGDAFKKAFSGFDVPAIFNNPTLKSAISGFQDAFGTIVDIVSTVVDAAQKVFRLFEPEIKRAINAWVGFFKKLWAKVAPQMAKFGELIAPLAEAFRHIWNVIKPILAILGFALLAFFKVFYSIATNILGPALNLIIGLITHALEIIRGIIRFTLALINGDWGQAWNGIKEIVGGIFGAIWDIIKGAAAIIWGAVRGLVEGVVGFFTWLWDVLVGHSIIPDMMHAIVGWFEFLTAPVRAALNAMWTAMKWVWDNVARPIFDAMKRSIQIWAGVFSWIWENIIKPVWNSVWSGIRWTWDNIGKPIFDFIRDAIKTWAAVFSWIWENIIKPAWDKISSGISTVYNKFISPIFSTFKNAVDGIGTAFGKMRDAIKTIFDKVKDIIGGAVDWIKDKLSAIAGPLKSLVDGVGKVGSVVGGVIGKIPGFAAGGVLPKRVGPGFVTNQVRAIVGEGGSYPEFVIPTDPRHADRAVQLWSALTSSLGLERIAEGAISRVALESVRALTTQGRTTVPALATGGILMNANGKLRGATSSTPLQGSGYDVHNEYHFHGDLSFPNITSGDDARTFVDNLKVLVND